MHIKEVDGKTLRLFMVAGAGNLHAHEQEVNDLNVFPVPDGDTGTNMGFTVNGAVRGMTEDDEPLSAVAKAMAKGALLGARGNSGVILSQFIKGISVGLQGLQEADAIQLAKAFNVGVDYAYRSVLKPTEGTILTVMREASVYAAKHAHEDQTILEMLEDFLKEARASLKRTPELLPVLKKAGVVDSGAAGLIYVIEGFEMVARGDDVTNLKERLEKEASSTKLGYFGPDSVLEYGYCTEFILQLMNAKVDIPSFNIKIITEFLETVGDSIVAIKDEDTVKIHVHTMTPGKVIEFCQQFGEFVTFKMENMSVQHNEGVATEAATAEEEEFKQFTVVSVCAGEGLSKTFKEMGADRIINGGQTMNPSSEDFLSAFASLNTECIFVLPNNSNIYLAAKQAAELYDKADVYVVNTHTIGEGYAAMSMYDPTSGDAELIVQDMERAANHVETLSVTYSIRDGSIDGVTFEKDDYICVCGKTILSASKNKVSAAADAIQRLPDINNKEIITVIYGKDVTDEEKRAVVSFINTNHPAMDVFEIDGGQDVYSFIIAAE